MFSHLPSILRETRRAVAMTADMPSRWRAGVDVLMSRLIGKARVASYNKPRTVSMEGGAKITYRMNRGDVQGLREVWMDECYRLPFETNPRVLVDLGANIGLTSVWLHRHYGFEKIIAVEALAENAAITKQNFEQNSLPGTVINAAIGPWDGEVFFESRSESNVGRVVEDQSSSSGDTGRIRVPMICMERVLELLEPDQRIDVLKLDIEGGEEALCSANLGWLDRVDAIVAEFHPTICDCEMVGRAISSRGFRFLPSGHVFPGSVSAFVRERPPQSQKN